MASPVRVLLLLSCVALSVRPATAQTTADSTAIRAAALDYIEGWYTADADRMNRALHPDLVKRRPDTGPNSVGGLSQMGSETLVGYTRSGGGSRTPVDMRRADVRILDIFDSIAAVRVDALQWVDHLQLARIDGEWKIVNVLWEPRPQD